MTANHLISVNGVIVKMNDFDIVTNIITTLFILILSVDICSNYYRLKDRGRRILAPVLLVVGVIGILASLAGLAMVVTLCLIIVGGML